MTLRSRVPPVGPYQFVREPGFVYSHRPASLSAASGVESVWAISADTCRIAVEALLPYGAAEIYFNLGSVGRFVTTPDSTAAATRPRSAWVVGPHSSVLLMAKEIARSEVVVVRLRPGLVRRVLGIDASLIRERVMDLEEFWGPSVRSMLDQLAQVRDHDRRLEFAEQLVRRRIVADAGRDAETTDRILSCIARGNVADLGTIARRIGISHRRMIALFDAHVGLKPKEFQRVARFRSVLSTAHPSRRWSDAAYGAGFTDQAHFGNDFRALTGMTPSTYLMRRSSVDEGSVAHRYASDR